MTLTRRGLLGRAGLALALLWTASTARAAGRPIRFERLSLDQGLSQSTVMCILQDSRGFIWIGTEAGLNRYDGRRVIVYRHDLHDAGSLTRDFVHGLAEDPSGDLWVATEGGGLARWDRAKDRFIRYSSAPGAQDGPGSAQLRTLYVDREGSLWVGTKDRGLARLDLKSGKWQRYAHSATDPSSLGHDGVYAIAEDGVGHLWIGTDGGLARFDAATGRFQNFRHDPKDPRSLGADRIRGIHEDRKGHLWVATLGGGLDVLTSDGEHFEHLRHDPANTHSLADDVVQAVLEDHGGRLWVGTRGGLQLREADGSFTTYRRDAASLHSLGDDDVLSILEDRGGILWFGTRAGGAARFNPRTWDFGHVPAEPADPQGLANPYVTSFSEDDRGYVWIGTMGGGLHELDRATGRMRRYTTKDGSLSDDRVMALLHDHQGRLWVGTMEGGLNRLDGPGSRASVFRSDPGRPGSLSANGVMAIFEDREGTLWVGTFGGGLNRLDPGATAFSVFRNDPNDTASLSRDVVTALSDDSQGAIWVGTEGGGLDRLDPRRRSFQHFRHDPADPASIADDTIYSLHLDPAGTLWAGTRSGLSKLESLDPGSGRASFRTWTSGNGLAGNVVYGIESDGSGQLWLSGSQGLLRFDPRNSAFKQFTASHGLQSNEFNFGAHYASRRGELYFGGPEGYNAFLPDRLQANTAPPPVVLTGFYKFNSPVPDAGPPYNLNALRLGYRDNVVSFDFAALDFAAPERNRYAYRLEGFSDRRIDLGSDPRVTLTNLDAGRYVLRVTASNSDGVWNEKGVALPIEVDPAPWKSPWAYVLYGLVLAGIAAAFVRSQQQKLARETRFRQRLEVEVRQRTEELAQKNITLEELNAKLQESALTDSLTGMRNRRFFFEEISREMSVVRRLHADRNRAGTEQPRLVFIMIDLDWFKRVNDTFGHASGDQVLVQMKDIIEKACRQSDVLIRWGGDEFLVVARAVDLVGLEVVPERIRSSLEATKFPVGDGQIVRVTCSIGFTCYPGMGPGLLDTSLEEVVALADRAMYAAKAKGRNAWIGLLSRSAATAEETAQWIAADPEELISSGRFDVLKSASLEGDSTKPS